MAKRPQNQAPQAKEAPKQPDTTQSPPVSGDTTQSPPVSGDTTQSPPVSGDTTQSPPVSGDTIDHDHDAGHESLVDEVEDKVDEVKQEVVDEAKKLVTVIVPKAFQFRVSHHEVINIKAGIQEMEAWMADHWWSKAHGVKQYSKGG